MYTCRYDSHHLCTRWGVQTAEASSQCLCESLRRELLLEIFFRVMWVDLYRPRWLSSMLVDRIIWVYNNYTVVKGYSPHQEFTATVGVKLLCCHLVNAVEYSDSKLQTSGVLSSTLMTTFLLRWHVHGEVDTPHWHDVFSCGWTVRRQQEMTGREREYWPTSVCGQHLPSFVGINPVSGEA